MGLFEDVARFGSKVSGDIATGLLAGGGVVTGQFGLGDARKFFNENRDLGRQAGGFLTEKAFDEFDEPNVVPDFIVDLSRIPRGAINLTGAAAETAGGLGDTANTLAGVLDKLNAANKATGSLLIPALVIGGAVVVSRSR